MNKVKVLPKRFNLNGHANIREFYPENQKLEKH